MARLSTGTASGQRAAAVPGTDSQQQAQALQSLFKRPKGDEKEIPQFQAKVDEDKNGLNTLVQQRLKKSQKQQATHRAEITALLEQAFHPPRAVMEESPEGYTAYPGTCIALNPTYGLAADVIQTSQALVADYDSIETMINVAAEEMETDDVGGDWTEELKDTERKLGLGRRKALRDVARIIGVEDGGVENVEKSGSGGDVCADKMEGVEMDAVEIQEGELQRVLGYAQRGVKRMVKGLPNDER